MAIHQLVPRFILEQYAAKQTQGRLTAVCLFVDISGFTTVTEALMQHGKHGAEVLADVMLDLFTPLVDAVHEQGGFIAEFAGDAFTAIFLAVDSALPASQATTAAWRIQQQMSERGESLTPYGAFSFSANASNQARME